MRPLKLLFLNHNLKKDGTYYRALPMAEALGGRGHRVTLLTVSRDRRFRTKWSEVDGVSLGETPNLRLAYGPGGYGVLDIVTRALSASAQPYDLIHMFDHKPNATVPGFWARAVRGVPIVSDWADWWGGCPGSLNDVPHRFPFVHRFEDWWEVQSKLWSDGVTTISRTLQRRATENGSPPSKTAYIPTGAPLSRIFPVPKQLARERCGLSPDVPLLGFVGISQSDLEILFTTLQELPACQLLLIGPILKSTQDLASAMGVKHQLICPGRVPASVLNDCLACADVLCLPMKDNACNRGRLPNKLLNYLAAGRPVLSSPVGDVAEILGGSGAALLAQESDFTAAVQSILDDAKLSEQLGKQARQLAETQFNWNQLVIRLEEFYSAVLDGKPL